MVRRIPFAAALTALVSCSGSTKSTATGDAGSAPVDGGAVIDAATSPDAAPSATGDAGVIPFTVMDQIFFGSALLGGFEVKLLDYTGACALEQATDTHKANSQYIELDSTGSTPFAVGTYTVGGAFTISLHQRDATCGFTAANATSGSLVVTSTDATSLKGSFTAELPGYGTVGGDIDAVSCDVSALTPQLDGGALGQGCVP